MARTTRVPAPLAATHRARPTEAGADLMRPGERVTVSGPPGSVPCLILRVEDVSTLPDLTAAFGAPSIIAVRAFLAELDASQVVIIAYDRGEAVEPAFIALLTPNGWRDLKGQQLTIEARPRAAKRGASSWSYGGCSAWC